MGGIVSQRPELDAIVDEIVLAGTGDTAADLGHRLAAAITADPDPAMAAFGVLERSLHLAVFCRIIADQSLREQNRATRRTRSWRLDPSQYIAAGWADYVRREAL